MTIPFQGVTSPAPVPSRNPRLTGGTYPYIGNFMVTNHEQLDSVFGALADPTRRAILTRLARAEATVGELARPFPISRPAVSKHLRVLERAGLVQRERDGRISRCEFDAAPMRDAAQWIERHRRFWEGQLQSLSSYVETAEIKKAEEQR